MRVGTFSLALTGFSVSCLGIVCLFFLPMRGLAAGGDPMPDPVNADVEFSQTVLAVPNADDPTSEQECRLALAHAIQTYGDDHESVGHTLNDLAVLYKDAGRLAEAEPLLKRSLKIYEARLGPDHPDAVRCCHELVALEALLELNRNAAAADRSGQSGVDLQAFPAAPTIDEDE